MDWSENVAQHLYQGCGLHSTHNYIQRVFILQEYRTGEFCSPFQARCVAQLTVLGAECCSGVPCTLKRYKHV